jgi:sugar/nucleoside kinase (ribokinase family)
MKKVLGMGNALVDVMTKLDNEELLSELNLPKGSMQLVDADFSHKVIQKTSFLKPIMTSGGSAANTIHGLAKLGIETGFIGKVGNDELGRFFEDNLLAIGTKPILLKSKSPTGKAIALVTPDSERTFATCLSAAIELTPDELEETMFEGYDYFHIEGYLVQNHELIESAMKIAKAKGIKISLDMASYNVVEDNLDFLKRITDEYVDIIFANEDEAKSFTGKDPEGALEVLACLCETAVVKIGKQGSLIKQGNKMARAGIIGIDSFDSTGAGDLYAAGFLYGLSKNEPIEECGRLGSLLSGKVIENLGAKISSDGWKFIQENLHK